MQFSIKILTLLLGIFFLVVFILLLRKKNVKPFYTTLWLLIALFMISLVVFESFYKKIATIIGVPDASFLIIVTLISFLLIYVLYLSIKISSMSDNIQELISHASILEHELRKLKKNDSKAHS